MKTFQEFLEEEKKKKKIEKLTKKIKKKVEKSVEQQKTENPDKATISNYGSSSGDPDKIQAGINAMMAHNKEYVARLKKNNPQ